MGYFIQVVYVKLLNFSTFLKIMKQNEIYEADICNYFVTNIWFAVNFCFIKLGNVQKLIFSDFSNFDLNFPLPMQSYLFSPELLMKVSIFSKTVHAILMKFCSDSTPKGAPVCAMKSKSHFWTFSIFSKTAHSIRTNFSTVR